MPDIIESSHFEALKNWLQNNPRYELKVRSYTDHGSRLWEFKVVHPQLGGECHTALSFGRALQMMSTALGKRNNDGSRSRN